MQPKETTCGGNGIWGQLGMEDGKALKSEYSIRLWYLGMFGCVLFVGVFLVAGSWFLEHCLSTRYFK